MTKPASRKPRLNREEQKQARTKELLNATWELFCKRGYDSVTIDQVAEFAGYSRMPIYTLFGDKQNLFFELWRVKLDELSQLFLQACTEGALLEQNLHALANVISEAANNDQPKHPDSLFFVVQTICLNREELQQKLNILANSVIARFATMVNNSSLRKNQRLRNSPEGIAAYIIALINGSSMVQSQTQMNFLSAAQVYDIFMCMAIEPA